MAKTFVLHDDSLNTKGFRLLTEGADLSQFKKNPVMFYLHDDWSLPIGKWENIRKEGSKILADAVFDMDDPEAAKIANKVEKDFLRMSSIGAWPPLELSEDPALMLKGQRHPTVTKWLVREGSIVSIGANHNAVRLFDHDGHEVTDPDEMIKLMDIPPKKDTKNSNQIHMKEVAKTLKLTDTATESEVLAKVIELQDANKTLATEKKALETQVTALTDAEKARNTAAFTAELETAVKDGRIAADSKDSLALQFKDNPAGGVSVLQAIPKRKSIADKVIENSDKKSTDNDRDNWNFMDWSKKDPKGLKDIKLTDPERFETLRSDYTKSRV